MRKILLLILLVGVTILGSFEDCKATLLTWKVTGEVDSVSWPLQHIFSLGDSVTLIFTFDTETPDSREAQDMALYQGAILTSYVTVGSYSALLLNDSIYIANEYGGAPYDMFTYGGAGNPIRQGESLRGSDGQLYWFDSVQAFFKDTDSAPDMLTSDALPTSVDNFNDHADVKHFNVLWLNGPYANGVGVKNVFIADITQSVAVPEPSTFLLLGAGLAGVGIMRRMMRR
jgi:hypothetical protein